jgi:hypothetical protein
MRNEELKSKKALGVLGKRLAALCVCFLALFCLLSCGLEAFYYIDYIPQGDYTDSKAIIRLPSTNDLGYGREGNYFSNFILFYRIYISDSNTPTGMYLTDSSGTRNEINPSLNSDYNGIYPITDITSTTVNTSNLETTFLNRRYFVITLAEEPIDRVLGGGSLGKTLDIFFNPYNGAKPTLSLDGGVTTYTLQRAISAPGISDFHPRPDNANLYRSFLNHADLCNKDFINDEINRDVATNSKSQELLRYTYVSIYIAATGKSLEMPPRTIYSQPTFVGIFRLTDWS